MPPLLNPSILIQKILTNHAILKYFSCKNVLIGGNLKRSYVSECVPDSYPTSEPQGGNIFCCLLNDYILGARGTLAIHQLSDRDMRNLDILT